MRNVAYGCDDFQEQVQASMMGIPRIFEAFAELSAVTCLVDFVDSSGNP